MFLQNKYVVHMQNETHWLSFWIFFNNYTAHIISQPSWMHFKCILINLNEFEWIWRNLNVNDWFLLNLAIFEWYWMILNDNEWFWMISFKSIHKQSKKVKNNQNQSFSIIIKHMPFTIDHYRSISFKKYSFVFPK